MRSTSPTGSRMAGIAAGVATGALFLLLLALMLSMGLRRGVNHDESQHLAAGAVLAHSFLLPYRDFPYFHMPYLVFMYGALFSVSRSLLLAARILNVAAGWLTLLLLWQLVRRQCEGAARWLLPAGAALLLFSNPIFREAFWRTWNHATSTLFCLAAISFAMARGREWRWFFSGIFIGLATGTRLTFAPLVAPLALAAMFEPGSSAIADRVKKLVIYCGGVGVALFPALNLGALAPAQFIFGNFTFNSHANVLFRQSYHDSHSTLHAKLLYPFTTLMRDRSNLALAVLFALLVAAALVRFARLAPEKRYRLLLALGLIPFALIGAVAASPSQQEYYYALMPILILALSIAATAPGFARWACLLVAAVAAFTTARSWHEYQRLAILKKPSAWPPVQFHEAGLEMRQWVSKGRVLTLEPLYPLEGGLEIYPQLVTGGIIWRTEPFIPAADRDRFAILGPDNFAAALQHSPPAAVLTTPSSELEPPIIAWARAHGYAPHLLENRGKLVDQATVWTRP
ncbi:MAG TPA: glycosyltransferase family 39 protein [Chthoniobacteraceae bacterium]|nr:glycosyltransferase family 39 protein [Chthoniobacteraceae bacterium]